MTLKINFNLNLPDSCCTLVPKNGVWTVPKIAACQIAKNAALLIPDYNQCIEYWKSWHKKSPLAELNCPPSAG